MVAAIASLSFNPMQTTNAAGSFGVQSQGYIQGMTMDSPAIRNSLAGGVLAADETFPMWGGVGIYIDATPTGGVQPPERALGSKVGRASTLTAQQTKTLRGFSVFDQDHSMINTPQSPVPLALPGMSVHYYRLGSGARIPVRCDPSLIELGGETIAPLVSWDFNAQLLSPYTASDTSEEITSMTWSNTNGGQVAVVMTVPTVYEVDDSINISGATNAGTAGDAAVNGEFVINTWTDTTHFTFLLPAAAGEIGVIAGAPIINVGVGALNVQVLDVQVDGCMVVSYDPATGYVSWDRSGCCALILI